jgi:hypothetical protein
MGKIGLGRLYVSGMAELAEVTESVRYMPVAFGVDRVLGLDLVAVLAGRGLGAALRVGGGGSEDQQRAGEKQDACGG